MHYSFKADISIIWKAEAKFTQYHPLGHTFYLKECIYLCILIASAYIFIVYLLPPFDKLAELCSSFLAYFLSGKGKGKAEGESSEAEFLG